MEAPASQLSASMSLADLERHSKDKISYDFASPSRWVEERYSVKVFSALRLPFETPFENLVEPFCFYEYSMG